MTEFAVLALRFGIAITMIVFGIHQLYKPEYWFKYLPKWLIQLNILPESTEIRAHGIGNLLLGILLISGIFPLTIAWLTLIWWISILPTVWKVEWESFFRDITIIAACIAYLVLVI